MSLCCSKVLLSLQVLCVEVEQDIPVRSLVPVRHDSQSSLRLIHLQPACRIQHSLFLHSKTNQLNKIRDQIVQK